MKTSRQRSVLDSQPVGLDTAGVLPRHLRCLHTHAVGLGMWRVVPLTIPAQLRASTLSGLLHVQEYGVPSGATSSASTSEA